MKTISTPLKFLVISGALFFFFSGCSKTNYYALTPEDLAWVVYSDGNLLHFKNPAGNVNTYYTFRKTRSYTNTGDSYYEETGISFKLQNDTTNSGGYFYVTKKESGTVITLTWPHFTGTMFISSTIAVTDTIGGKIYHDIYVGNSPDVTGDKYVQTIYYSRQAGMVQFTDRDAVTWVKTN
ncbi:MAG: hypothetical protein ABIT08_04690 [Bacteroidia bacterium]